MAPKTLSGAVTATRGQCFGPPWNALSGLSYVWSAVIHRNDPEVIKYLESAHYLTAMRRRNTVHNPTFYNFREIKDICCIYEDELNAEDFFEEEGGPFRLSRVDHCKFGSYPSYIWSVGPASEAELQDWVTFGTHPVYSAEVKEAYKTSFTYWGSNTATSEYGIRFSVNTLIREVEDILED